VGPVLYVLLKKLDRREWAWWLIPLVSIASSVVIFTVGVQDKSQALAHSIRTVELTGDGRAERAGHAAVFVPRAGKVTAAFEEGTVALPYWEDGMLYNGNIESARPQRIVRYAGEHTETVWRDVPLWSVRKTAVHLGAADGYGSFEIDANYAGGTLDIAVTNGTAADLTHVGVLMNGQVFRIGSLKIGESGKISIPYSSMQQFGGKS